MPQTTVSTDVLKEAVHLACRAPSIHNSQPWRWIAGASTLELHLDVSRLVRSDSSGRQALISCGAVLDHLQVAMAAAGWASFVDRFPNPNDHRHLASIDFAPMEYVTDGHHRRAQAIGRRRTDRLPFAAPKNPAAVETALRQAVTDAAILDVLGDDARPALVEAAAGTEAARLYDSAYHAELDWWTSSLDPTAGIPHSALVSAPERDRVALGRRFPVTHHEEQRREVPEDRSLILVLSAYDDTRQDVLRCGEALSALLLTATMDGLATCTLTHLTETPAGRDIVSSLTGRALPEILIRVGSVPTDEETPPPTPRRPLAEVLIVNR
ncbi:NAD(P)H nitroreductase [Mycolicibacterium sp. 120266]|uniref:Acg family FMN-binding oxidoreductase n=1 Tax=Mycolicibacterium sp. 120266 TaxID=3090601 RepID=UPI00299F453A|nr:NAD(P)H nitroreductase [Mycolicibacterium sp. 120266]MDX1875150.1 NAD(P)H nitroreductase [Mycolicibacterium sp. 120266]